MKDLIIHTSTRRQLERLVQAPSQVLVLAGPEGSGKLILAQRLAETIIGIPANGYTNNANCLAINPEDGKAIGIEAARRLERFLRLKVPGKGSYNRAVIIEDGHLMTVEAQNALLKTLEEPPVGTIIIITVSYEPALLPTVRSRAQTISIERPDRQALTEFFNERGFDEAATERAYALTGGLIGSMSALLEDDEHPLRLATEQARQLLSQSTYDRLITVDTLSKDKPLAADTVDILQRMARISLQAATGKAARKWQSILGASYKASEALAANAQPKLVLTELVLQF